MSKMDHELIEVITDELDKNDLIYTVEDSFDEEVVWFPIPIKNGPNTLLYITADAIRGVTIRCELLTHTDKSKRERMLTALNLINFKYRYTKASMDSDGDVWMVYDISSEVSMDDLGEVVMDMIHCFVSVTRKAYPLIATALYTDAPIEEEKTISSDSLMRLEMLAKLKKRLDALKACEEDEEKDEEDDFDFDFGDLEDESDEDDEDETDEDEDDEDETDKEDPLFDPEMAERVHMVSKIRRLLDELRARREEAEMLLPENDGVREPHPSESGSGSKPDDDDKK